MKIIETHIVPDGVSGVRFSDYACGVILSIPSRKGIKKAIKEGLLIVEGEPASTGLWMKPGQRIDLLQNDVIKKKTYHLNLDVVYEDDYIAIINKPSGIPVNGNRFKTLENSLPHNLKPSHTRGALARPSPVHRIDSQTSGLVLVAKTWQAQINLGAQFEERSVKKVYRAVVLGLVEEGGAMDFPLDGREALTEYSVIDVSPSKKFGFLSLVELLPRTGRTHQLRRHMSQAGHPIVGDRVYTRDGEALRGKGLFLSAVGISFLHPVTGSEMKFEIKEPEKFRKYMVRERNRSEVPRDQSSQSQK